jgi:hypothetical protein
MPAARRDHELVVFDAAAIAEADGVRMRIDAGDAALDEVDVTAVDRLGQVDDEIRWVGTEGNVDRVRAEGERLTLGHERQVHAIAQPHPQQERGLETREAGAEDRDA